MRAAKDEPEQTTPQTGLAASPADTTGPVKSSEPVGPMLEVTVYERVTSVLLTWMLILGVFALGFGAAWVSNRQWAWLTPKRSEERRVGKECRL